MLHRAAVHIGNRFLAVAGELMRQFNDIAHARAAGISVFFQRHLEGTFLEQLEGRFDLDAVDGGVNEQVALLGCGRQGRGAVHQYHAAVFAAFGDFHAQFAGFGEFHRLGVDQMRGIAVGALAVGMGSIFVRGAQESGIVAFVFDNPADHAQRQCGVGTGFDGHPLPGLAGRLGEARVHHGILEVAFHQTAGDFRRHVGRAEVGLEGAGAEENHEFRVGGIGFHVVLAGSRVVGDVVALLADGGVQVEVDRTKGGVHPALDEFLAAMLHAPALEDELVVDRPQVGVVGVNQQVEVRGVLGLEFVQSHVTAGDGSRIGAQFLAQVGVAQFPDIFETVHMPFTKQVAAVDHFVDELVPFDGNPFVLTALAGALEHLADAVGVVGNLHARLALGADRRIGVRGFRRRGAFSDVRLQVLRAVGVAVDFDQRAVQNMRFDGAGVVAVQADAVQYVFRVGQRVTALRRLGRHRFLDLRQAANKGCRTADHGRHFQKITARKTAVFGLGRLFLGHVISPLS